MARPRVSIIVDNHDYERFVGDAVDSALAQTEPDVQVVVVDDGSTDGSLDRLRAYGERIALVAQPNGGQGSAFNAGFAVSTGDVVLFLDADDVLARDAAARVADAFAAEPALARVQFRLAVVDAAGRPTGASVPAGGLPLADGDVRAQLVRSPDDLRWMPTSGNAFARWALERILPMPTEPYRICADYYLSNLVPVHGPVRALDHVLGSYRVHAANSHHRNVVRIADVRTIVQRTETTHELLAAECRRAGLPGAPAGADEFRSVSDLANRLVSLRVAPGEHPLPQDTRRGVVADGVRGALGRREVPVLRRLALAGWFVAAAVAPHAALPLVYRPFGRLQLPRRR